MNHISHLSTFRHSHIYGAPQVLHWAHFYGVGSSAWIKVICKTHISSVNFCAHVFWGVFKALFKVKNKQKWSNWLCYTFFGPPSPLTLHCIHSSTTWIEPVGWKQKGSEFGKRKKNPKSNGLHMLLVQHANTHPYKLMHLCAPAFQRRPRCSLSLFRSRNVGTANGKERRASSSWWRCYLIYFVLITTDRSFLHIALSAVLGGSLILTLLLYQKGFPCSSVCANMLSTSKAAEALGFRSKETSKSQVTHLLPNIW